MPYLSQADLPETFPPYRALRESLSFLPAVFPAQSLLPRLIEAEARLAEAFLHAPGALSRVVKEQIGLAVAAADANRYCVTAHARVLSALGVAEARIASLIAGRHGEELSPREAGLVDFGIRLARRPASIGPSDIEGLRAAGLGDPEILDAILSAGLARFLCTLSTGLGVEPDFEPVPIPETSPPSAARPSDSPAPRKPAPHLAAPPLTPGEFPPFAFLRERLGFVPAIYRAQTSRPGPLEAEIRAVGDILLTDDVLPRRSKELLVLAVSAASFNTYGVAVHAEMLRVLGVPPEISDQVALDHRRADLPEADKTLLDVAVRLATKPAEYGEEDARRLREAGFSDPQILEAIAATAMASFLNTVQAGLGTPPDFRPRRDFAAERAQASRAEAIADPDAPLCARAREGDRDAFEAIVRRHQASVYRTLLGLTGNVEDAEDCSQIVFVKVFRKIRDFEGASRFSTWLTRIAIHEGLERLRSRRPSESLDEEPAPTDFRPSRIEPWIEDPERLYAREETRRIVQQELSRLPALYRTAVMLRDIEQLPAAEAAAALDIPVATLKTRLLRGRLMMREALAAYFTGAPPEGTRRV